MKLLSTLFAIASIPIAAQPLILQPEVSPDGDTIAFTYQGDVWTVSGNGGRANRLTIHEGYDSRPVWTTDSKAIAFSSDRNGNNDVFLIDKQGGKPNRLTFHSSNDLVTSVSIDNQVLFNSRRTYAQVEREWEVLAVNINGQRTESRFMDALGFDAVVSPDGSKIAFVRGTNRIAREAYRGPANRDVWLFDKNDGSYTQLTQFEGNDFMPKWVDNNSLYFLSSRSGKYNIHELEIGGGTKQVTNETAFGINHFSTSANGEKIVYQTGDRVYAFSGSAKQLLNINVNSDFRFDPVITKTIKDKVEEYVVSPNGKLIAYVVRGDIYVTRNDEKDSRSMRLTQGADRDRNPVWLNNNALVFVSDRYQQNDLFVLTSTDENEANLYLSLKHEIRRVTDTPEEEFDPVISPNHSKIAFRQDRGKLVTASISETGELGALTTLIDGWDIPSLAAWSPDSEWIAYSLSDLNFNEDVFIHAADGSSDRVNVSMHPKRDANPVWSPDGSKLGFISSRNNSDADIWFVWLSKQDWQRSNEEWRLQEMAKKDKPKAKKSKANDNDNETGKSGDESTAEVAKITIDFDGIYERLSQVTAFAANESEMLFTQDGEHIFYTVGRAGRQNFKEDRNLYKIKWDGKERKTLIDKNAEVQGLALDTAGKQLFALTKGGKLNRINVADNKKKALPVSSKSKIDYVNELEQVFEEGWRALNAGFYDPNFHGKDWDALKNAYKPLALKASTKEDFQYIFNLMLGQLNASHMGMRGGENLKVTQKLRTGLIGIEGIHSDRGFEVLSVLSDSPADRVDSKLLVGDVITAVNQQPISQGNFYAAFVDTVNTPVLLELEREGGSQEIVIWPTQSLRNQLYDAWVDERRRLTDEMSGGKLGYLHIRGMNWTSFERFERELMAAGYNKEGIVIDVRYNGGGWTTDYLMAVLSVKQHAYTIPRGAINDINADRSKFENTYPFSERLPLAAWTKPSIAMSNENSYSNAEIFSHAYKALGLGKLVGRPTFGAVISTGAYRLVDGSAVRMPFRGWWVKESGDNMERVPAMPDIEVFNPPAYKAKGVDPQLKRAVEELLKDI